MAQRAEQIFDLQFELQSSSSFARSVLPRAMGLAKALRIAIWDRLKDYPAEWRFSDRVLVWLRPSMRGAVEKFYKSRGRALEELYPSTTELEAFDESLLRQLVRRMKTSEKPSEQIALYLLLHVLLSVKEAEEYPRPWHDELLKMVSSDK